jgi:hypothetical protein
VFAIDGDGLDGGGCGRHVEWLLSDVTDGKSRLANEYMKWLTEEIEAAVVLNQ